MACFHPNQAYQSLHTGTVRVVGKKTSQVFLPQNWKPLTLPCGQCTGCRLEHSRQWAIRCMHEAQCHDHNCFVTLTINDDHLPPDRSLSVRTHQFFIKRLRKKCGPNIRFYLCGEYGDRFGRPHYHALLFNHHFPDMQYWKKSPSGEPLYRSRTLEKLWTLGYSSIGSVTFESAAYVSRYIMKKRTGKNAENHYILKDEAGNLATDSSGNHIRRLPEYTAMSRSKGIGHNWYTRFSGDVYPSDEIILQGKKYRPPKYYDRIYQELHPEDMEAIKTKRQERAAIHAANNTTARLRVREAIQMRKLDMLRKTL